jgi:hypothetical protein
MGKLICKKNGFQVWVFRLRDVDKKVSIMLANSLKYSEWESLSIFLWARSVQINFRRTKRAGGQGCTCGAKKAPAFMGVPHLKDCPAFTGQERKIKWI